MKDKLLHLIDAARRKEQETLVPRVDDSTPPKPGQWTAKDVVAHMMSWRLVAIGELEAVRTGSAVPDVSTDDDAENEKFYAQTHDLPARSILESAERSWDRLAAATRACTEEQLQGPRPRYPSQGLWQAVQGNTYFHVAEHLGYWYEDQGDEAAAEQAAIWGHDLILSTYQDERRHGAAYYNLGCFYAKRGRADKALPLLERGLKLRPDLKEPARSDTDLDPIRSQLTDLLA